jgi:hypothetical protein
MCLMDSGSLSLDLLHGESRWLVILYNQVQRVTSPLVQFGGQLCGRVESDERIGCARGADLLDLETYD